MAPIELDSVIPPMPTVMLAVMRYDLQNPDSSIAGFESMITPDKGISAEILRVANSSVYGRSGKISTLREAITLLGLRAARGLVVFLITRSLFRSLKGQVFHKYLTELPVAAALIAQDLAKPLGGLKQDEAFLAALFHKIGMTILAMKHGKDYAAILETAQGSDVLASLEKNKLGTDHRIIGAAACAHWKLPPAICEVASAAVSDAKPTNLAACAVIAEFLARVMVGIPISDAERGQMYLYLADLGKPRELLDAFTPAYFQNLREHPFFTHTNN